MMRNHHDISVGTWHTRTRIERNRSGAEATMERSHIDE